LICRVEVDPILLQQSALVDSVRQSLQLNHAELSIHRSG